MITKLAVALVIGNPFAGGGLSSTMAGAGFDTLCSEAAINMIENDGKPGRALQAMRQKNIVKTVARSVTAAGLNGALGVGTAPTSVESFAKEFLARSAVQTTMAIAFDGVKPGEAIRQGALNAAVQTVGACIANKIGDMASSKMGPAQIGDITQDIFHGFLGAGIGAGTAAITGQDIGKGATSGAIGAVVGHRTAKTFDSKALGDLVAATVAMMTDQDVGIAYMASNNATTYNYAAHRKQKADVKEEEKEDEEVKERFLRGVQEGEQSKPTAEQQEYERGRQRYVKESLEQARRHRGRELSDRSRERVIDSASKVFGRYHASCETLGIMTDPANVLKAGSYVPGMSGALMGIGEAAYGLHKGTHDELDAVQAVIAGSTGGLGKAMKGIGNGMSALKKADGTRMHSSQGSHHVVDELLTPAHPVTVGGLATKYSGKVGTNPLQPSTSVKSQHFVEMMQETSSGAKIGGNLSITWVDEKAIMGDKARFYNDSVSGARSNVISKSGQAPSLFYSAKDGSIRVVRFDGLDGSVLIDRKLAVVTTEKAMNQAIRQSKALKQNGLTGRWEVPDVAQATRAQKMFDQLNITNIEVKIVDVPRF